MSTKFNAAIFVSAAKEGDLVSLEFQANSGERLTLAISKAAGQALLGRLVAFPQADPLAAATPIGLDSLILDTGIPVIRFQVDQSRAIPIALSVEKLADLARVVADLQARMGVGQPKH